MLCKREGESKLEHWKAAVCAWDVKKLISFVEGLAYDAEAIANAYTEEWNNGMGEGFNWQP